MYPDKIHVLFLLALVNMKTMNVLYCDRNCFFRKKGKRLSLFFMMMIKSLLSFTIQSQNVAASLLSLGLQKGDRLAMLGNGHSEWIVVFFACMQIGVTVVSQNFTSIQP